jgi:hypothetical protein
MVQRVNPGYSTTVHFLGGIMFLNQNPIEESWQAPPAQTEELPSGLIGDEI